MSLKGAIRLGRVQLQAVAVAGLAFVLAVACGDQAPSPTPTLLPTLAPLASPAPSPTPAAVEVTAPVTTVTPLPTATSVPSPAPTSTPVPPTAAATAPPMPALPEGMGAVQVRVTNAPGEDVFSFLLRLQAIETHLAGGEGWVTLVEGPIEIDLIGVSGIEQVVGESILRPGRYIHLRLQVTNAEVRLGTDTVSATIPSGELELMGSFEIEEGNTTVIAIDFDAAASVFMMGPGDVTVLPVARLVAASPTSVAAPVDLPAVSLTGLLAVVPGSIALNPMQAFGLIDLVHPGRAPRTIQTLLLLTESDQPYLVVALDTVIERSITAGTVSGRRVPPLLRLPETLDFVARVLVSDDVTVMEPVLVTPTELNQFPDEYAFKRVALDATYEFSGATTEDAPPGLGRLGFGAATDRSGSASPDDYVTVVDRYSTDAQVRVGQLTGAVLSPTAGVRLLLGQLLGFTPEDVEEALARPSVFYEDFVED